MRFIIIFILIISTSYFQAFSQTITGCRTPDELWIYYSPATPSNNGNVNNRTFYYLPTNRYATNYSGTNKPCTVTNPQYTANSSGLSGDYGVCIIKFSTGDVEGRIFRGELVPCNVPLDEHIPIIGFLFAFGSLFFFRKKKQMI